MTHADLGLVAGALHTALAYLDPGTGSLILQGILAGIAMAAVAIKMFWRRILVFLRIRPPAQTAGEEGRIRPMGE